MSEEITQEVLNTIRDCKWYIDLQLRQSQLAPSFSVSIVGAPSSKMKASALCDIFSGYLNKWCDQYGYRRYRELTVYSEDDIVRYNFIRLK